MRGEIRELGETDREIYQWQMWVREFGEAGQRALKNATVLISRVGGVGGAAAYYLACAGIGKLVLAHAGNVRLNDLNRQILMTREGVGKARVESAARRLKELNPDLVVEAVNANVTEANAAALVGQVDMVVDCAPLFEERFLLNRECVLQNKPMVECAMYDLEGRVTTIIPGKTPCLACLYPETSDAWKREFPVFGAVAGTVGSMGALEAIKLIAGVGETLAGRLAVLDLRSMNFRTLRIARLKDCAVCGQLNRPD